MDASTRLLASPSPDLMAAQNGAKTLIGIALQGIDGADSEDTRSTVGGDSCCAEDSRSTVWEETDAPEAAKAPVQSGSTPGNGIAVIMAKEVAADVMKNAIAKCLAPLRVEKDTVEVAGSLDDVLAEESRLVTRYALEQSLVDGSLEAILAQSSGQAHPGSEEVLAEESRLVTRYALEQGLVDGSLDAILAQSSGQSHPSSEDGLARCVADGRLDALLPQTSGPDLPQTAEASGQDAPQPSHLLPKPPTGTPSVGCPARARRLVAGSSMEKVMNMISEANRKVGSLQVELAEKKHQIQDRDATCQQITENIQFVRADLEHLSVDLQWHQDQLEQAKERWGSLNDARGGLALKLDEMRLQSLKDDWSPGNKQFHSPRSLTSTMAGGANTASTAIGSPYSGWDTEQSAVLSQSFLTQNIPMR